MNHVYRFVWSEAHCAWVAVAEIVKGRSKRSSGTFGATKGAKPLQTHALLSIEIAQHAARRFPVQASVSDVHCVVQ